MLEEFEKLVNDFFEEEQEILDRMKKRQEEILKLRKDGVKWKSF